ncbi:MAG: family 1 glycosylhydrolase [Chloroflexota bacterium]|nr:family 1 glycosylhydrolase [Chloroflexota bacterium]
MITARSRSPLLHLDGFVWAVGIEDTIIGRPLPGGGVLDEYALTQHDRFWRADLDRAASLGVRAIRYGIPWHRVNPAPGRFDWAWADEVLTYAVRERGLLLIADLVHYGTPPWLEDAFVDPAFPRALAGYAGAFASRYASLINHYTPLNEPLVTASFCGERGIWPPYLEGSDGWLRVVFGAVSGIRAAIAAIRQADPNAVIVHVEAAKLLRPAGADLDGSLAIARERAFLPTDLLLGRVEGAHPLAAWLSAAGVSDTELQQVQAGPVAIDLIGINYYPELSVRELVAHEGRWIEVTVDGWDTGLIEVIEAYWDRYGLPVLVGETSTEGDEQRQVAWLDASAAALGRLRAGGVPVRGYTWWPLFDFVDWSHASGGRPIEEFWVRVNGPNGSSTVAPVYPPGRPGDPIGAFLRRMGAWRLEPDPEGTLHRVETAVVDRMRALTADDRAVTAPGVGTNVGGTDT